MLYYTHVKDGNFGDDLNPWLWARLAPEINSDRSPTLFVCIGSLLSDKVPAGPAKVVFGSGFAYGRPARLDSRWYIYAVRGPRTAATLGLDPALALADPAILVRCAGLPGVETKFPVSFMPHHQSFWYADWQALCLRAGIHCIDARAGVDHVLQEIRQTRLLLTESMHGAIVADALRVPWVAVRLYGQFSELKWRDWAESLRLPLRICDVPPIFERSWSSPVGWLHATKKTVAAFGLGKEKWKKYPLRASGESAVARTLEQLRSLARGQEACMSDAQQLRNVESRLYERLQEVRGDWRRGLFRSR